MVEARTGQPANEALVAKLHGLTAGNPLFVDGMVRVLAAERKLTELDGGAATGIKLPDNVRGAIAGRLGMLSEEVRSVLAMAATIGPEFEVPLLARISELNADLLAGAIDEGCEVSIVVRVAGDRYQFTHPLIREALLKGQKDAARLATHRAIGDAIEHLHATDITPHVAQLAHHFREAGIVEQAVDYSIRAGKAAFEAFAFEEAFSHLQAGLELINRHAAPLEKRAEVLHILSEEAVSGSKCIEFLEAAVRTDEAIGDKESLAWAQGQLGLILCSPAYAAQNVALGLRHLRAAEPTLSRGPPRDNQCRFFLQLAPALTWALEVEAGLKAATRAMEVAEQLQDGERDYGLSLSASVLGRLLIIKGQLAAGFSWVKKGWEIADRINNTMAASTAAWNAANMYWGIWDPVEAEKWCTRELASTRTSQSPPRRLVLINRLINSKAIRGALDEALELVPQTWKGEGSFASATSSRLINFHKGAWNESDHQFTRFIQRLRNAGDLNGETNALFWGARVKRTMGDLASARDLTERCISICRERSNVREMQMRPEAVLLSTQMNRLDEARCHLDRCREIMVDGEDWRGLAGGVARADAVLAAENGRFAESEQGFENAVAIFRRYQVPFEEAETFWFWGRALKATGDSRANEKFDASVEIYRRHETGPCWIERVASEGDALRLPAVGVRSPGLSAAGESTEGPARFKREGEFWTLTYRGTTFRLKGVKGLAYIAFLLGHPGERIHVHELIARVDGVADRGSELGAESARVVPNNFDLGDAGDALDQHAQADYRRRLRELTEDVVEARRLNDSARAESIRRELEFLQEELSAAVGIGGRDRRVAAHVERARGMVTKNIRAGLEKIRSEDAALGRYFATSIKTGYYCAYLPDPDRKISWQL
jgi:tetratricopeptide (TPR) repeat protein